ncbi:hypothetical protein C7H19_24990 [Aphanothece hegewaldii CCALA 016]|uniref:BrnT family toxin n=1 Tax=Aphanothece hegewaldii CCALA 016 TaxID=2107694 RepID=A0A2T1LQC8_9CHRO|nr:BrnT family toxin [Aphanothece hegewaldii]PSF27377.1 hypothetical protein C7H19_24990 [Aphanothece hegewaldii CCALA 016]
MSQIEGFEWDEKKRWSNLKKHGIDFADAYQIFSGDILEIEDQRSNYGEERFLAIGVLDGQVLAVVYTLRGEQIRLISARKATKDERKIYGI